MRGTRMSNVRATVCQTLSEVLGWAGSGGQRWGFWQVQEDKGGAKRGPSPQVHPAGSEVPHPAHFGTEEAQEQGKRVICSRCRACRSQSSRWQGVLPPTQTALSRGRPRDQGKPHLRHQADDHPWGILALPRQGEPAQDTQRDLD